MFLINKRKILLKYKNFFKYKKGSFSEAINSRGLEQLAYIYQDLQADAVNRLPKEHDKLGDLICIDGSLIDACLSMLWADYRY